MQLAEGADGDDIASEVGSSTAADEVVAAMAMTAKGNKALTAAKKRPAAAKMRPAAAGKAAPVAKKPAAAGAASAGGGGAIGGGGPRVVKAKKGWHLQVFARNGADHGASYTVWVEPSGKRHRTYKSAAAAGFVS